mmetsp:Transcript_16635/g.35936  ORF Transcript_16635/g.35936 Transcript_16635/m.35936 type:complete len:97 (+) Transcript_16635:138-428(+)
MTKISNCNLRGGEGGDGDFKEDIAAMEPTICHCFISLSLYLPTHQLHTISSLSHTFLIGTPMKLDNRLMSEEGLDEFTHPCICMQNWATTYIMSLS